MIHPLDIPVSDGDNLFVKPKIDINRISNGLGVVRNLEVNPYLENVTASRCLP
jgi:hypothetical protein